MIVLPAEVILFGFCCVAPLYVLIDIQQRKCSMLNVQFSTFNKRA